MTLTQNKMEEEKKTISIANSNGIEKSDGLSTEFPKSILNKDERMNKIQAKDVNCWYGDFHVLRDINMEIKHNTVTALIGPSGCGKSTYLRIFNRMNDLIEGFRLEGEILIDNKNVFASFRVRNHLKAG